MFNVMLRAYYYYGGVMAVCILQRTITIDHEKYGEFKFEIYSCDRLFYAEIYARNSDGRWMNHKTRFGLKKAMSVDDAQASCELYISNLGK